MVNGEWRSGGWYQQIGGSGRRVNRSPHEITSTDFSIIGGVSHGEKNRQMRPIMRKNRKKARKSTRNLIACCAKQIQIPLCTLCSLWLSEKTKPIWNARIHNTGNRIQNEKTKPILAVMDVNVFSERAYSGRCQCGRWRNKANSRPDASLCSA